MYKRSRRKIIAAIMISLVLFLAVVLSLVFILSAHRIEVRNLELLAAHAEHYFNEPPGQKPSEEKEKPSGEKAGSAEEKPEDPPEHDRQQHEYIVSTFYSVLYSESGEFIRADDGGTDAVDESELIAFSDKVLNSGKKSGRMEGVLFLVEERDGRVLVAFMDDIVAMSNLWTFLNYSIIAGVTGLVLVYFIALWLSKKIVAPLEANDRSQRRFISDAGHELKTPIAVINTNSELLAKTSGESKWLANIRYENKRMEELVKLLLELSRAESSDIPKTSVDFSKMLLEEEERFSDYVLSVEKTVLFTVEPEIMVRGNETQLQQLINNLLSNAVKHSIGDGDIRVELSKDRKNACLTVSNKSDPMDPEQLKSIFERFFRVDNARENDGHYGLGLSIVKAVADGHGGTADAVYEDGRMKIIITLPLL